MLLLDWYVFQSLKTVMQPSSERYRTLVISVHWTLSVMAVLSLILFPYISYLQQSAIFRNYVFAILVGLFLAKMVASLVFLTDDLRRGVSWIVMRVFSRGAQELESGSLRIPRSAFMSWLGLGLGLAGVGLVAAQKAHAAAGAPLLPLLAPAVLALLGITAGTLYQKRFCPAFDLRTGALIQFAPCLVATLALAAATENLQVR